MQSSLIWAQGGQKKPFIIKHVRDSLYLITIGFTNISVLEGPDALLFIDASRKDFMLEYSDSISRRFGNKPVTYIINTHSHFDHTGGNTYWMNKGATCIAHTNAGLEMNELYYVDDKGNQVAANKGKPFREHESWELPQITFSDSMKVTFASEEIELIHVPGAHTVGDVIVRFKKNNAIALGDNYFGNAYTFGDNIRGMIKVYDIVLNSIDDETVILPGHGIASNKFELRKYMVMIKEVSRRIDLAKANGRTIKDVKADKSITAEYDETYGKLYINGAQFRELIYHGGNRNE